jgi:hypothetical protein
LPMLCAYVRNVSSPGFGSRAVEGLS